MSYYTIFDEVEALLTSTSTGNTLASTDALLVHNVATGKKFQTTLASIATLSMPVTYYTTTIFTANTTAASLGAYSTGSSSAFIPNTGLTLLLTTAGTSCVWVLADPTVVGQVKQVCFKSSSSSTNFNIQPVAATIFSSGSQAGTMINFGSTGAGSNSGNSVTLTALSTTTWMVTGKESVASGVSSSVVVAAGLGPIFT